mgnify:FL=1
MGLFKTKDDVVKKPSKKELKKNKKNSKRTAPSLNELEMGLTQQQFDSRPAPQNIPNNNQNFFNQQTQYTNVGYQTESFDQGMNFNQYQNNNFQQVQQNDPFVNTQNPNFTNNNINNQAPIAGQLTPEFYKENAFNPEFNSEQNTNFSNTVSDGYNNEIPQSVYRNEFDSSLNPGMNPAVGNFVSQATPQSVDVSKLEGVQQSINLKTANFEFEEDYNPRQETLKEGMAPSAYSRGEIDFLIVGSKYARVFCIEGLPDQVYIGYLRRLYSSDYDLDINLSIQPRQQSEARKELQDKLTIVRAQLEEEIERGANRNRDTFQEQIDRLEFQIAELSTRNEFAFEAQFLFTLYADSREELSRNTVALMQELKEEHITPQVLALRQDEGYRTVVPYAIDYLQDKKRNFNTGAVISSIPFYIPELYDDYGVYLGTNTFSGTPALLDMYKKGIQNSNLNVFGSSGSGKSTLVKFLTMRSSLHGIRTVIIDPEGEYGAMTKKLHGAVFRMSTDPTRAVMMNLFDIEEDIDIAAQLPPGATVRFELA